MRILVDENVPLMTITELKKMGHDIRDIRGSEEEGLLDSGLWKIAQKESRLFITTDKGFAQYRKIYHYGVLIVLLRQPNRYKIHEKVMLAFNRFSKKEWRGRVVIIRDKTINISTVK